MAAHSSSQYRSIEKLDEGKTSDSQSGVGR